MCERDRENEWTTGTRLIIPGTHNLQLSFRGGCGMLGGVLLATPLNVLDIHPFNKATLQHILYSCLRAALRVVDALS